MAMAWLGAALAAMPVRAAEKATIEAAAAARGQVTFGRYCVSCHGKAARGDGPLAADLRVPVPDLTTLSARNGGSFPYDHVVEIIKNGEKVKGHGSADMPAWGDAFKRTSGIGTPNVDTAIRNLARYVESLQRRPAK
jgi:mono/diheme cytochrome c family protein